MQQVWLQQGRGLACLLFLRLPAFHCMGQYTHVFFFFHNFHLFWEKNETMELTHCKHPKGFFHFCFGWATHGSTGATIGLVFGGPWSTRDETWTDGMQRIYMHQPSVSSPRLLAKIFCSSHLELEHWSPTHVERWSEKSPQRECFREWAWIRLLKVFWWVLSPVWPCEILNFFKHQCFPLTCKMIIVFQRLALRFRTSKGII